MREGGLVTRLNLLHTDFSSYMVPLHCHDLSVLGPTFCILDTINGLWFSPFSHCGVLQSTCMALSESPSPLHSGFICEWCWSHRNAALTRLTLPAPYASSSALRTISTPLKVDSRQYRCLNLRENVTKSHYDHLIFTTD